MSQAEQITDINKTITECDAWIASYERIIAEGNEFTIPFDLSRRDSWRDMRAEAERLLTKLKASS
jgi:hypothetical protein